MLAIEHNPTHIESALPEGRVIHSKNAENRLEGIARKKNRKNNGLGAFSRLLAGLVSKKTLSKNEGNPHGLGPPKTAEIGTKKAAFSRLSETKGIKPPKENLSVIKGNRQGEPSWIQGIDGLYPLNFELQRMFPADDRSTKPQTITFEPASLKADFSGRIRDISERRVPFKKGETAGNQLEGDFHNAAFQSKREEKTRQAEKGSEGNPADSRKAGRKRFSVEVQDFRTQTKAETGTIAERGLKGTEEIRNGNEKEITVELRPAAERSEKPAETGQKAPAGEHFEQILARELQGDLSADIVRQAAIVLRDGGEGTIKLSLKPETLGKVKIQLEMAENRVSGFIFVETEEALRAFEQEIHTLEQFFRDSGFEASLNAALDYRDGGQRWKENEVEPFFSERFAASYEESSSIGFNGGFNTDFGINAVNVLV